LAKNKKSLETLQQDFKERRVEKGYLALAFGHISPQKGEINIPLERSHVERLKRTISAEGKSAVTKFEVSEYIKHNEEEYSLLDLRILTGRTHQIRVHLESIGHPIVGDRTYTNKAFQRINDKYNLKRQFLHAYLLGFHHPKSKEWLGFKSALPKDLANLLLELKQ